VKITVVEKGLASVFGVLLLAVAISLGGCASYSHSDVQPDDAAKLLRVGDYVRITRKDDTTASVKIEDISDTGLSGSLGANILGRKVSIPYSEIGSITLYTRDSFESEATSVFIALVLAMVVTASIF